MGKNPIYTPHNPATISKNIANGQLKQSIFTSMAKEYTSGGENTFSNFSRYVVLDVIFDPKIFSENDPEKITESKYRKKYNIEKTPSGAPFSSFPRNSIVAKRIDGTLLTEESEILFPFFPSHLSLPCKPGEHVWCFHESESVLGYWLCKIPTFDFTDDPNHTHAPRDNNVLDVYSPTRINSSKIEPNFSPSKKIISEENETISSVVTRTNNVNDEDFYEKLLDESDASKIMDYEPVPRFKKRPGDIAIEGSNNTLIVLGTDRSGSPAKIKKGSEGNEIDKNENDLTGQAGSIDIVVGRGNSEKTKAKEVFSKNKNGKNFKRETDKINPSPEEGNPDILSDKSRILISQKTKIDQKTNISELTADFEISDSENGDSSILIKTEKIRLLAEKDVVILVGDASIIINSNGDIIFTPSSDGLIKLGGPDANLAMLCNTSVNPRDPTSTPPIIDSMGGSQGSGGAAGQFATKILVK